MKKNLTILIAFCLLAVLSAGCRHQAGAGKRIILRYVSYEYLPSQIVVQQKIIDAFNKSQDRVSVKMEIAEKTEKILTQLAGGEKSAPDVFLWFSSDVYDLAQKGVILQLDPYIQASKVNLNDYFSSLFDVLRAGLDNKLYAFPTAWGAEALAYNKVLFDQAGIPYPNEKWTWDDFLKAAQKLTVSKNGRTIQYGTALVPEHILLNSFGIKRFDDKVTRSVINTPDARKAYQFMVDLGSKYKVSPSVASLPRGEQYQTALDMFMTGKMAMFIVCSYQLEALSKAKDFQWDVAPIPRYGSKKRTAAPGINTLVIYSKTKHPQECWEFIKFFTGPEGERLLGKNCVPAHKEVTYKYFMSPPPEHLKVMVDQYEATATFPEQTKPWFKEYVQTVCNRELDKMLLGLETVDQGIKIMDEEAEKCLKSGKN